MKKFCRRWCGCCCCCRRKVGAGEVAEEYTDGSYKILLPDLLHPWGIVTNHKEETEKRQQLIAEMLRLKREREEEAARLKREKEERARRLAEQARLRKEKLRLAEQEKAERLRREQEERERKLLEEARLREEARLKKLQEEEERKRRERERLLEEARLKEENERRLLEEARLREEARLKKLQEEEERKRKERERKEREDAMEMLMYALENGSIEIIREAIFNCLKKKIPESELKLARTKVALLEVLSVDLRCVTVERNREELYKQIDKADRERCAKNLGEIYDDAVIVRDQLDMVIALKKQLKKMDNKQILAEVASYNKPPEAMHKLMVATYVLLGEEETDIEKWKDIQTLLAKNDPESLRVRAMRFDVETLDVRVAKKAKNILAPYTPERMSRTSAITGLFYKWCIAMIDVCEKIVQLIGIENHAPSNFGRRGSSVSSQRRGSSISRKPSKGDVGDRRPSVHRRPSTSSAGGVAVVRTSSSVGGGGLARTSSSRGKQSLSVPDPD